MEFSRQEYWSGLLFLTPGDLPNPGIEPTSLMSSALAKEKQRIDQLRENVGSTHLHVTFEPMFNDIGEVDLHGISWIAPIALKPYMHRSWDTFTDGLGL